MILRGKARHRAGTVSGRGRVITIMAVAGLVAVAAPAAVADNVYNTIDITIDVSAEAMNLGVGGPDGTVTLKIDPTNGDGKNGCNLTGSTTLKVSVSSSDPAKATVSPSTLTFASCGDTRSLTVHPVAAGASTISLVQTQNNTGATFDLTPATFTVNVAPATPPNTPPKLSVPTSPVVREADGPDGASVTFSVTATDAEDNPPPTPSCNHTSGSVFPIGDTTVTCSVTDSGGLTDGPKSFVVSVVDTKKPVITLSTTSVVAASGWYNASSGTAGIVVTATATDAVGATSLTCTDGGSPVPVALSLPTASLTLTDGVHAITCTATDAAGNAGSASATYQVDQTAPAITRSLSQAANTDGWNNADVTIKYECSDATSGLATGACPADDVVNTEGSTTKIGTVVDQAGNSASISSTVNLDKTKPTISGTPDRAANKNDWYRGDVTVSFACADALSDIKSCSAPATLGEGVDQSVTGNAVDNADNSNSATVSGIDIDETAPVISAERTAPNGAGWNNGPVTVTFHCSDALSGVDTVTAPVTLGTDGAGQSVTGTCVDKAGNTSSTTVDGINIDTSAPVITGTRSPGANAYGWNNGSVTVGFTCADTGDVQSGLGTDTVAGAVLNDETDGTTVGSTGTCVDNAGNTAAPAQVGPIRIDRTAPVITGSRTPDANTHGWNNADVTVSFTCTESGTVSSGIAVDDAAGATVSTEGADQSVTNTGSCSDKAGNVAVPRTVGGISIDKTVPTIVPSRTPAANANGWNNTDVTVSFSCADTDGGSGIPDGTVVTGGTVTGETAGASVSSTGDCVDKAGNAAAPATVSDIKIDRTAPVVTGSASPASNASGWNTTDVTVSFSCAETGPVVSGIDTDTVAGRTLSTDGANLSVTNIGACADKAGNAAASATVGGINLDETSPSLAPAVTPNPVVLNGSATAGANASDGMSGVASSGCGPVDTSSVGSRSVTCTAADVAGNTAVGTAGYQVVYAASGACLGSAGHAILQPINADGSSVFKLGSTVPAKFRVCDANGNSIGTAGLVTGFKLVSKQSVGGTVAVNEDVVSTTPDSAFRWDATAQQWIFNIATKGQTSGTKLGYVITLNDGSTIPFSISLK